MLACVAAADAADAAPQRCPKTSWAKVAELTRHWLDVLASGDAARIAALYAPDAILVPAYADAAGVGPTTIGAYYAGSPGRVPHGPPAHRTIKIRCTIAVDTGLLAGGAAQPDAASANARYTLIYEYRNGRWMIVHDHGSLVQPPAAGAKPASPSKPAAATPPAAAPAAKSSPASKSSAAQSPPAPKPAANPRAPPAPPPASSTVDAKALAAGETKNATNASESPGVAPPTRSPGPPCASGTLIGVLVVGNDTVRVNDRPAPTGQEVCAGDKVATVGPGDAKLMLDRKVSSDAIYFGADTDPRFARTAAGCIKIEDFNQGSLLVVSNRLCVLVRTRDAFLYQEPSAPALYATRRGTQTSVSALPGSPAPTLLRSANEVEIAKFTDAGELLKGLKAPLPHHLEAQPGTVSIYKAGTPQRPTRLQPAEIHQLQALVARMSQLKAPPRP